MWKYGDVQYGPSNQLEIEILCLQFLLWGGLLRKQGRRGSVPLTKKDWWGSCLLVTWLDWLRLQQPIPCFFTQPHFTTTAVPSYWIQHYREAAEAVVVIITTVILTGQVPPRSDLLWPHPVIFPMGNGVSWLGCETDHSYPSSEEFKNVWIFTPILPYVLLA